MVVVAATVVVLVAVLLVGAVVAERWARTRGVDRAAAELGARLGLERPVTLHLAERPLLPPLLRGGSDAQVAADDVPVGDDARLRDLTVQVRDVRLRPFARCVVTGPGSFTATIDERELARILPLPAVVSRVELRDSGLRVWTVLGVPIDADVLVADGALRVLPDPVQVRSLLAMPGLSSLRLTVDDLGPRLALPALPLDAVVTAISVDTGRIEVVGDVPAQTYTRHR